MKAALYHIQVNVSDGRRSFPFYRQLFEYLDGRVIMTTPDVLGVTTDGRTDVWFMQTAGGHRFHGFHRKRAGINHLAFRVSDHAEVDRFHEQFLRPRGLVALYGGPREYPEYAPGYYAVFFEDPDRIKLEIAHVPPRPDRS